ncbi:cupin domain-containing protein [uncultured Ramlibacter sp.]|uniref:cupin domain-containing protein n=1 Tax=uncultured Ramlibacter sp. TaxID=260755 RepID=UPI002602DD6C|nr:cupin domain-containing protein [uncultured Ramlibacter sp.]
MAAMGPQQGTEPRSAAEGRARYFNSANAFNIKLAPVPAATFVQSAAQALHAQAATGWYACDQSQALGMGGPATTPLMLARYARIAAGESLEADFVASGSIWYVISGAGKSEGAQVLEWAAGDVLFYPGAEKVLLTAGATGAVLWVVTDEPLLAFDGLVPAPASASCLGAVHYPAQEIARQLQRIEQAVPEDATSGRAVVFSHEALQAGRNILPVLTLSLNTLPPGDAQRAHRHNSAAITLIVDGDNCHSMVGGVRCEWERWATMVTPPGSEHSHHNAGGRRAEFLIVQDGGLHYHARTMAFAFA